MSTIPASPNEPTIEILLVEDNLINQKVLSKQLRRSGWTVNVANHGVEALDFIKTSRYWRDNNNKGAEISFILLDVVSENLYFQLEVISNNTDPGNTGNARDGRLGMRTAYQAGRER